MALFPARSDAAVRRDAADWVARVHDVDAAVDRAAFERWRAADPRHAAAFARAERAWGIAGSVGETRFGRSRPPLRRRRGLGRPRVRAAIAAGAVAAVSLLGVTMEVQRSRAPVGKPAPTEFASRIGQVRRIVLTDGSTVTLDTDSLARTAFARQQRGIFLVRGRARFEVARDSARPFIVFAGSTSVTARGTMFDVGLDHGRVKVVLLRGVVEVRRHTETSLPIGAERAVRLEPGQQVTMATAMPTPPLPVTASDPQWPTGMLIFDRTRLDEALAEANRYSTGKIAVADPVLNDRRITGAYRAGDAEGFARSVAASLGLSAVRSPRGDLLIIASPSR